MCKFKHVHIIYLWPMLRPQGQIILFMGVLFWMRVNICDFCLLARQELFLINKEKKVKTMGESQGLLLYTHPVKNSSSTTNADGGTSDCFSCRVLSFTGLAGSGVYVAYHARRQKHLLGKLTLSTFAAGIPLIFIIYTSKGRNEFLCVCIFYR